MADHDLDAIQSAHLDDVRESTHWSDCHLTHPLCAIAALLEEVRRLRRDQDAWQAAWEHDTDDLEVALESERDEVAQLRDALGDLLDELADQGVDTTGHEHRGLLDDQEDDR